MDHRKVMTTELNNIAQGLHQAVATLPCQNKEMNIKTRATLTQDSLMLKRATMSMVKSVESILKMTTGMKQSLLLRDVEQMNETIGRRKYAVDGLCNNIQSDLKECLDELDLVENSLIDALNNL